MLCSNIIDRRESGEREDAVYTICRRYKASEILGLFNIFKMYSRDELSWLPPS